MKVRISSASTLASISEGKEEDFNPNKVLGLKFKVSSDNEYYREAKMQGSIPERLVTLSKIAAILLKKGFKEDKDYENSFHFSKNEWSVDLNKESVAIWQEEPKEDPNDPRYFTVEVLDKMLPSMRRKLIGNLSPAGKKKTLQLAKEAGYKIYG